MAAHPDVLGMRTQAGWNRGEPRGVAHRRQGLAAGQVPPEDAAADHLLDDRALDGRLGFHGISAGGELGDEVGVLGLVDARPDRLAERDQQGGGEADRVSDQAPAETGQVSGSALRTPAGAQPWISASTITLCSDVAARTTTHSCRPRHTTWVASRALEPGWLAP